MESVVCENLLVLLLLLFSGRNVKKVVILEKIVNLIGVFMHVVEFSLACAPDSVEKTVFGCDDSKGFVRVIPCRYTRVTREKRIVAEFAVLSFG